MVAPAVFRRFRYDFYMNPAAPNAPVPGWDVVNDHHLHRVFPFPDFQQALNFVNRAGAVAEEMGHHPDILLAWGRAEFTIFTHTTNGLTKIDFMLAERINLLTE